MESLHPDGITWPLPSYLQGLQWLW